MVKSFKVPFGKGDLGGSSSVSIGRTTHEYEGG
ncbi:hypothetical protein cce_2833 [Crocosphaera subtropica ATCC 51142]|uniref:Uncharacterized protein n=1 Tax=Crocosphaera subtropica (strain ATCC 51142 / BH68) TaxID=43989 RepID=B1WUY4_CROS5|nr:hypothetical protein cce_2833 [Crocosphaera subtropica ATCC 51142]